MASMLSPLCSLWPVESFFFFSSGGAVNGSYRAPAELTISFVFCYLTICQNYILMKKTKVKWPFKAEFLCIRFPSWANFF